MSNETVAAFELAEFVNHDWMAARRAVEQSVPDSLHEVMATAHWVETIGWLLLGVDLDMLPKIGQDQLLKVSHDQLKDSVRKRAEPLNRLVHPQQMQRVTGFVNSGILAAPPDAFGGKQDAWPYFRAGLSLSRRSANDLIATSFQEALLFVPETLWASSLDGPVSLSSLTDFIRNQSRPLIASTELSLAGFLRTVDMMVLWQTLLESLRADTGVPIGTREALARHIGHLTTWRVCLQENHTRRRFLEVAMLADATICDLLALSPVMASMPRQSFVTAVEKLIKDWLRSHPFYFSQTSSA